MRLLRTNGREFGEFFGTSVPRYAILSHRWTEGEVSFEDYEDYFLGRRPETNGWKKIRWFAELARDDGFEWCWIDTCCIDKRSSAELSEAINSMYRWYEEASECIVFLFDVNVASDRMGERFEDSTWFGRGWTLQELLAPRGSVLFYDKRGRFINSRKVMAEHISSITGIDRRVILEEVPVRCVTVETRKSWAARRTTTRPEDMAYCLLGLFNVHMPLLYGEGERNAFRRLQIEIDRLSADDSEGGW